MALIKGLIALLLLCFPPWGWLALAIWGVAWYFSPIEVPDYSKEPKEPEWESTPLPEGSEIGSKVE